MTPEALHGAFSSIMGGMNSGGGMSMGGKMPTLGDPEAIGHGESGIAAGDLQDPLSDYSESTLAAPEGEESEGYDDSLGEEEPDPITGPQSPQDSLTTLGMMLPNEFMPKGGM